VTARELARNEEALEAFERETALPMLVLSLAVVPLIVVPLVVHLSHNLDVTFFTLGWVVWAAFAVEYVIRFYLAPYRGVFFRHNLLDLVIVVLPFLRPLRIVRSARALRLLRSGRAVAFMARGSKSGRDILTRHGLQYALLVGAILVATGALLVGEMERDAPGATIHSFGDAIWWALATMSTVGFGDKYPVTEGGRAVAIVLMFFGIGLFGLIAASLASFFVGQKREEEVDPMVEDIRARLERMERVLARLADSGSFPDGRADDQFAAEGADPGKDDLGKR
jgi:voltage-gated potassium channel